jgi:hypothetical protein
MRLLTHSDLHQVYSHSQDDQPKQFWAIPVLRGDGQLEAVQGIPHDVLSKMVEISNYWSGWGFGMIGRERAFLLFEDKEDALFAKIHVGENVSNEYN